MSMRLPWASSLDGALACAASVCLPQIREASTPESERGVVCHSFLENVALGKAVTSSFLGEHEAWCRSIDLAKLFGGLESIRCEQVFIVDLDAGTVRLPEYRDDNDYQYDTEREIPGRCDLDAIETATGIPVVADHKTGKRLKPVRELYQLRFFALAVHLLTGAPFVKVRVNYIEPDGAVDIDEDELGPDDHDETKNALIRLRGRIRKVSQVLEAGGVPTVTVGDNCTFCKCYAACPAKAQLLKKVLPDLESWIEQIDMLTPDAIGAVWAKAREVENMAKRVKTVADEAVKRVMPAAGIQLETGELLRMVESSSKSLNQGKLIKLAKSKGASDQELADCYGVTRFSFPKITRRAS